MRYLNLDMWARVLNDEYLVIAKEMLNVNADRHEVSYNLTKRGLSGDVRDAFDSAIDAIQDSLDFTKDIYVANLIKAANAKSALNVFIITISSVIAFILALILGIIISLSISDLLMLLPMNFLIHRQI